MEGFFFRNYFVFLLNLDSVIYQLLLYTIRKKSKLIANSEVKFGEASLIVFISRAMFTKIKWLKKQSASPLKDAEGPHESDQTNKAHPLPQRTGYRVQSWLQLLPEA